MAVGHILFSNPTIARERIRVMLSQLEQGLDSLDEEIGTMTQMIDGDGSQDSHYDYMRDQYGFATSAVAHAAFNELASVKGKVLVDDSVSGVHAALTQAFSKFR